MGLKTPSPFILSHEGEEIKRRGFLVGRNLLSLDGRDRSEGESLDFTPHTFVR